MTVKLVPHTTPAEESAIERQAQRMGKYEDILVYRNHVDVALASVALAALQGNRSLTGRFNMAVGSSGNYCVIGINSEDKAAVRQKVNELVKVAGFTR